MPRLPASISPGYHCSSPPANDSLPLRWGLSPLPPRPRVGKKQARKEETGPDWDTVIPKAVGGGCGAGGALGIRGGSRSRNHTGDAPLQLELFWRVRVKNRLFYWLGSDSASAVSGSPGPPNPQSVCVSASQALPQHSRESCRGKAGQLCCVACAAAERWGENPSENRSCLKPGLSAKPSTFQGLLCCGFNQIPG